MIAIDDNEKNLTDLGWANGWAEMPPLVRACQAAGHAPSERPGGPVGGTLVECAECGYRYRYDSGD